MIAYGHRIATTNTVSSAQTQKPSTKATTVAGVSQEGIGLLTAAAPSWPWTGTGCDSASYHNGAAASRSTRMEVYTPPDAEASPLPYGHRPTAATRGSVGSSSYIPTR